MKFGRLLVVSENGRTKHSKVLWHCMCDCGNTTSVPSGSLVNGNSKSCGCLRIEAITSHGASYTPEYNILSQIKQRCNNSNAEWYSSYGGRGITICDRWNDSFENFIADMGYRPSDDLSIERINNDGNYEPGNCKWGTGTEQQNNRRNNVIVNYKGKNYTLTEICKELNVLYATVQTRLSRGWSIEEALETDVQKYVKH